MGLTVKFEWNFSFAVLQVHFQMVPDLFKIARPPPSHCKESSKLLQNSKLSELLLLQALVILNFLAHRQLLPTMICLPLTQQLSLVMNTRPGPNKFLKNNHKKSELNLMTNVYLNLKLNLFRYHQTMAGSQCKQVNVDLDLLAILPEDFSSV